MKINDYIHINYDKIYNNKEFKLYYDGYLTSVSNNKPISLRYGDQDWNNLKTVEMKKDENGKLFANIKLNNFNEMNFCFNYDNVWDNNFSNNYSLKVSKFDLDNYKEEENLEEHLSNTFLESYNIITPTTPEIESDAKIFENSLNIDLAEMELDNLKESLEKLFPDEQTKKLHTEDEHTMPYQFANSFSPDIDNFVEIVHDTSITKELFKPKEPIRNIMIERFKVLDDDPVLDVAIETEKIVLRPKVPYRPLLMKIAKENELRQIVRLGDEEEAQFLVVSPYSEIDIYDNSLIGTIKRYVAYITTSFKKIFHYLKENLSTDNLQQ